MIVVDTNLIGYLFLSSERSGLAEAALRKDAVWAAPRLWRSELRNVLALYLRKHLLTLADAQQVMRRAENLMQGHEYDIPSFAVLQLVASSSCSAYDCEFVALAQDLHVPLVTVDRQVLANFSAVAIALDVYTR